VGPSLGRDGRVLRRPGYARRSGRRRLRASRRMVVRRMFVALADQAAEEAPLSSGAKCNPRRH